MPRAEGHSSIETITDPIYPKVLLPILRESIDQNQRTIGAIQEGWKRDPTCQLQESR
jgi:hypothetical protein